VGFWHAHLGLKNQYFFGSEYGSLVIAGIILLLLLLCYYFAIKGNKTALVFYLICAFSFITFNLNYFYPYDFKEDLVREDAGILKDNLQSYATRAQDIAGMKPEVVTDYLNLIDLKEHIISEVKEQHGYKQRALGEVQKFNAILAKYKLSPIDPTLAGVTNYDEQARILDERYLMPALKSFSTATLIKGEPMDIALIKMNAKDSLQALQERYTPVLEFIQRDTTKIDISNDKKNIENNPKNIAQIATIASKINSVTKPVNEIYKNIGEQEPFVTLEAPITKLGSVGHTMPSIVQHIKSGTKEQKVGAWKNIFICLLIDLLVPLAIYTLIRKREDDEHKESLTFWEQFFGKEKNFNKKY
jgi:hypothetical protein